MGKEPDTWGLQSVERGDWRDESVGQIYVVPSAICLRDRLFYLVGWTANDLEFINQQPRGEARQPNRMSSSQDYPASHVHPLPQMIVLLQPPSHLTNKTVYVHPKAKRLIVLAGAGAGAGWFPTSLAPPTIIFGTGLG